MAAASMSRARPAARRPSRASTTRAGTIDGERSRRPTRKRGRMPRRPAISTSPVTSAVDQHDLLAGTGERPWRRSEHQRAAARGVDGRLQRGHRHLDLVVVGLAGGDRLEPGAGRRDDPPERRVAGGGRRPAPPRRRRPATSGSPMIREAISTGQPGVPMATCTTIDTSATISRKLVPQRGWRRSKVRMRSGSSGSPCS